MNAGKILSEKGMTVTELTPEQIDAFRKPRSRRSAPISKRRSARRWSAS